MISTVRLKYCYSHIVILLQSKKVFATFSWGVFALECWTLMKIFEYTTFRCNGYKWPKKVQQKFVKLLLTNVKKNYQIKMPLTAMKRTSQTNTLATTNTTTLSTVKSKSICIWQQVMKSYWKMSYMKLGINIDTGIRSKLLVELNLLSVYW